MIVLIFNLLLVILYAIFCELLSFSNKSRKSIFLCIAFFHLLFLHTFFDQSLFPDLDNYFYYFKTLSNPTLKSGELEIGWYLLNKFLFFISNNEFILILGVSTAMIYFYLKTIKKYSAIAWLSVFILLCTVFYNSLFVLRQHLAIPICLLTVPYIIERKPLKFTIITLIAISIHLSAVVWLISYLLYSFKLSKLFYFKLVIASVVVFYSINLILENILLFSSNIMAYTEVTEFGGLGTLKSAAVNLSSLLLALYSFKKFDNIIGYNKLFFQLTSLSLILILFSYFGAGFALFDRLSLYYSVPSMFLIPNSLYNLKRNKFLHYSIIIPFVCLFYVLFLNGLVQYGFSLKL